MGDISSIRTHAGDEIAVYIIDNQIIYVYSRQNMNVLIWFRHGKSINQGNIR